MKENVIIVNCKVPGEAAQILSALRKKPKRKRFQISYGALVKKDAGKLSLEDGFVAEDEEGRGWTGGLIGGLVGLLAGPVGTLVVGGVGALIGNSMDEEELKDATRLLEKASECLTDGETALLLMAEEQDEAALAEKLSDFQISITRLDAKEIADEIKHEKKQKRLKAAAKEKGEETNPAPDYSKAECWYKIPEITKDVDTFYIYATEYIMGSLEEGAPAFATLDNAEMLAGVQVECREHATAFADSTNVFVPYYRQSGLQYAGDVFKRDGNIDAAISGQCYDDITAALDYYFENYNGGRPFIIAGHSQGSALVRLALKKYFKEHPDRYQRMVAAYVIGYSITKEDLETCPHMKFATGESDTGVIIAWNTEGIKNVEENAPNVARLENGISINPLNWKLDETYAPASLNLGSLVLNEENGEYKIGDVGADAQINLTRGVVVTNAKLRPMPEEVFKAAAQFFGSDARHDNDYTFYYNNIKDNVAKRIAAYQASR